MRRTGVRNPVYWNFIIHHIFPEFLQQFRDLRITRFPRSIGVSFLFVFGFLLAWVSSGLPELSSTEVDTGTGEEPLLIPSSRSRIWISPTVGEEDEDEEDEEEEWLSCFIDVRKVDEDAEEELDKPGNHDRNEVFRIANYPNPVFNEMWFLTIDPFVGLPVFIAKLTERQYCWRVIEDVHSQEYTQFFDIHNCLFMRLHLSIGGYDYRRTTRLRQSIHFSITQVLFADRMHWRTGVDNNFSFLRFKISCRQAPIFRRWEECCSFVLL